MQRIAAALLVIASVGGTAWAQDASQLPPPQFTVGDVYTALMDKAPAPCPSDKTRDQCETVEKTRRWQPARRDGLPPSDLTPRATPIVAAAPVAAPVKPDTVTSKKRRGAPVVTPTSTAAAADPASAKYLANLSSKDILATFAVNSADLTPQGRANLNRVAQALVKDDRLSDVSFEVAGYTDAQGDDAYNQALSERRAQAARDYLISCGVPADRLTARGYGESHLRAPDDPLDGINRRVEMVRTS